jgi:UDP-N-acetylglucosamine 2-epimerase (non-hydrolysing)
VERRADVALAFPVHPNPQVREPAAAILSGHPRIRLLDPLEYTEFIRLLSHSWLIVSDSGGAQEEAPTLGKPLLNLRENTERPEAVEAGVARLVGGSPERLAAMLEEVYADDRWIVRVRQIENPFGRGDGGERIAQAIVSLLGLGPNRGGSDLAEPPSDGPGLEDRTGSVRPEPVPGERADASGTGSDAERARP